MVTTISEEKKAVEFGYWHLYRYAPRLKDQGQNPFQLDSKEPSGDYQAFLRGEIRYSQLENSLKLQKSSSTNRNSLERFKTLQMMQNGN